MFVRFVRAAAIGVVFACAAGFAWAQDTRFQPPSDFAATDFGRAPSETVEDVYVADPSESFVVEHSSTAAAVAPSAGPRATRCREYSTDADGYEGGLACPQSDGSWRIVAGREGLTEERDRPPVRAERTRARDGLDYPDYADEDQGYRPEYQRQPRPGRRLGFDWNAWRRGSDRWDRGRFNE